MIIKNFLNIPFLKSIISYEYDEDILLKLNDYNNIVDITCGICLSINFKLNICKCSTCSFMICLNCYEEVKNCSICFNSLHESKEWLIDYINKNIKLYCNYCKDIDCQNYNYDKNINNCNKLKNYEYIKSYFNFKNIYMIKNKENNEYKFNYNNINYHGLEFFNNDKLYSIEKFSLNGNYLEYKIYYSKLNKIKIKFGDILNIKIKNRIDIDCLKRYLNCIKNNNKIEYLRLIYEHCITNLNINLSSNSKKINLNIILLNNYYHYKLWTIENNEEYIYKKKEFYYKISKFEDVYSLLMKYPNIIVDMKKNNVTKINNKNEIISIKLNFIIIKSLDNKINYIFKKNKNNNASLIYLNKNLTPTILTNIIIYYDNLRTYFIKNFQICKLDFSKIYLECQLDNGNIFKGYLINPNNLLKGTLIDKNKDYEYEGEFYKEKYYGKGKLIFKYYENFTSNKIIFEGYWQHSKLITNKKFKIYDDNKQIFIKINNLNDYESLFCNNIIENLKYNKYFNKEFRE